MNTNNTIGMPCDNMSREELIAVMQNLLRSNTRLRDERMSLIVSKRGLKVCYDNLSEQYKELESENAKLRKLARGLNWCTENVKMPSAECEYCPLEDAGYGELACERLMRELGIEVEDD